MSPDTATTHQRDPRTAPRPPPGRAPRRWALAALAAAVVAAACSSTGPPTAQPAADTEPAEQPTPGAEPEPAEQPTPGAEPEPAEQPTPSAQPEPGAESGAEAGAAQAGGDELIAGGERGTERERMLLESLGEDPDVDTVEPDCDGSEAPAGDEDTVRLCFVAFGDPSFDGSGPDRLIEGVRITVAAGYQSRTDGEKWWKSVHGPAWFAGGGSEDFSIYDLERAGLRVELWPGEMVRSTPESVAGAEVPFVVTGADGTASVTVQRHEPYQLCAVHPDDAGLVAGCGEFDPWVSPWFAFADELPANAYGHRGLNRSGTVVFTNSSEPQRSVFVYFSRGRAFFDLDLDSGRYGRFLAGGTHPPGTGKVTHTGFMHASSRTTSGPVLVPLGGDRPWTVAVVKDEDIGEFFEAVSDGWFEQLDFESPPTWAPATLLRTGPDGTVTADLDAGDYLFCTPYRIPDCTYEDVTAGQHRILYRHIIEGSSWLVELDRANSVALVEAMAACDTPQETVWCRSRERYEKARQHLQDTGEWPEDWL